MSRRIPPRSIWLAPALTALLAVLTGCEPAPVNTVQHGYRGTGMVELYRPASLRAAEAINTPPAPSTAPQAPADGPKASAVYQNVKILGDLSVAQFAATMVDITSWVAPAQGCTYCHSANFAEDTLYTKVAARRMLQMTQHINSDWKQHVAETGVTCYTCHRGNNVPAYTWYESSEAQMARGMLGNKAGQNSPAVAVGLTSLPNGVFQTFLQEPQAVRVISTTALPALPASERASIKQTEATYGLMVHMSQSLGVNCTYCHNTRSFAEWDQSTPQRQTAYYGIRLARDLNNEYIASLSSILPAGRMGPNGDVPKLNCGTCHQGAYKPLYGAAMLNNHPALTRASASESSATAKAVAAASPAASATSQ